MIKVKTFGIDLKPMKTIMELSEIDKTVNTFIEENKVKRVISVSDAATTDDTGKTIGLVRVLCYEI
jgi:hypothetical protein